MCHKVIYRNAKNKKNKIIVLIECFYSSQFKNWQLLHLIIDENIVQTLK